MSCDICRIKRFTVSTYTDGEGNAAEIHITIADTFYLQLIYANGKRTFYPGSKNLPTLKDAIEAVNSLGYSAHAHASAPAREPYTEQ